MSSIFKPYASAFSFKSKCLRLLWMFVYPVAFRSTPRGCCNGWRCLLLRMFGAKIGVGAQINPAVKIWAPWNLEIEQYSAVDADVNIYNVGKVVLKWHAIISQGAFICTASHDISSPRMDLTFKPIVLGAHSWVCARCVVLPGVSIGEGAVCGAGSVVTRDVPAWTVVAGNPAREIGKRTLEEC